MSDQRPNTPSEVARALRKEAGFGCPLCGNPILDYHHIIPWETEKHFRIEDMVAICPTHHREVALMPLEDQRKIKADPINIRENLANGRLIVNANELEVNFGGNFFIAQGTIVSVDFDPLISLSRSENGRLELSVNLYSQEDNLIALIDKNDWVSNNEEMWDFEFHSNYFIIRKAARNISLMIDATKSPVEIKGELWRKSQSYKITPSKLVSNGVSEVTFQNMTFHGFLNIDTENQGIFIHSNGHQIGLSVKKNTYLASIPGKEENTIYSGSSCIIKHNERLFFITRNDLFSGKKAGKLIPELARIPTHIRIAQKENIAGEFFIKYLQLLRGSDQLFKPITNSNLSFYEVRKQDETDLNVIESFDQHQFSLAIDEEIFYFAFPINTDGTFSTEPTGYRGKILEGSNFDELVKSNILSTENSFGAPVFKWAKSKPIFVGILNSNEGNYPESIISHIIPLKRLIMGINDID